MRPNRPHVVDDNENPLIQFVKGLDPAAPDTIVPCYLEVRPGGMVVYTALPRTPDTVAPDPEAPPTFDQVEEERRARAREAEEREREARKHELEAAEADGEAAAAGTRRSRTRRETS